jgi:hypothetical protein
MELLLLKEVEGDAPGRGVDPLGVDGVAPPCGLAVEVPEVGEGAPEEAGYNRLQ